MTTRIFYQSEPGNIIPLLKQKNPNHAHPRILLNREKVQLLRSRVQDTQPHKGWMDGVIDKAEQYLDKADTLRYELRDGVRLLYVSREALEYISNLGFAWQMTGDVRYAQAAKSVLMKVCGEEFPDWHPYHFLDTAEMAAAVALGYDWCYDVLTEEERRTVRAAVVEKAFKPVLEDYDEVPGRERTWTWSSRSSEHYPNNWTAVCFGGTTMAALSIADEDLGDFARVEDVVCTGLDHLCDWLEKHLPDGICPDGTGYWYFSMEYMALGLNAMQTALGTTFGVAEHEVFDLTFRWLTLMMGPAGPFNIECNNGGFVNSPEYFWYSAMRKDTAMANYRLHSQIESCGCATGWEDILWYEPEQNGKNVQLPLESTLDGAFNVVILRSGFGREDTFAGMMCGHADKQVTGGYEEEGNFVLDMLGQRWFLDLGPEWQHYVNFEVPWVDYYRCRAEGHNTMVFNPDRRREYDVAAHGKLTAFEAGDAASMCTADLSSLVKWRGVDHWSRTMRLDKKTGSVTVSDVVAAQTPFEFYWFAHTQAQIELEENGKAATLSKGGKQVRVQLCCEDAALHFTVMEAKPLPTSPDPKQADNTPVQKLAIHKTDAASVKMEVAFIPLGE